ncbi:radical SAM protein [bacterium]|nr:radical SAM protein [bacterium]
MKNPLHSIQLLKKIVTRYPLVEIARTVLSEPRLAWAYQRRSRTVPCLPARMMIDPCNRCNLKCPLCPTGRRIPGITPVHMPFEQFEHIVNLNPRLKMIDLFNLGEPFLNKDIFRMTAYCGLRGIRTGIHTNLSAFDEEFVERIIENPPTRLHLSIDGARQETYEIYRQNGDFNRVRNNMERLSTRIREKGKGPVVEWAFLYHKHNHQDLQEAEAWARRLGFKFFARPLVVPQALIPDWHNEETSKKEPVSFKADVVCPHLWLQMTVRPNGAPAFCCFGYLDKDDLAEPLSSLSSPGQLLELWNSSVFRRARHCFDKKAVYREIPDPILCEICTNYPRTGGLDPNVHPYETPFREWINDPVDPVKK